MGGSAGVSHVRRVEIDTAYDTVAVVTEATKGPPGGVQGPCRGAASPNEGGAMNESSGLILAGVDGTETGLTEARSVAAQARTRCSARERRRRPRRSSGGASPVLDRHRSRAGTDPPVAPTFEGDAGATDGVTATDDQPALAGRATEE